MRKRGNRKTKQNRDLTQMLQTRYEKSCQTLRLHLSIGLPPPPPPPPNLFDWLARSARACSSAWLCSAPLYSALRLHNQQRVALNGATNHIKSMSLGKF